VYYYIVNPAAGKGEVGTIQDKLKATLHSLGIDGEFNKTIGAGDAAKITRLAIEQGFKTIVAVGGDSTVNEVITAVHSSHKANIAVGIIPTGKQNLMANHLGINGWQQACEVLATRRLQTYQLMSINNRLFIYDCTLLAEGVWQPQTDAEGPVWQTFLDKAASSSEQPFEYLLDLDQHYKVRGQALQITVSNQKFLDTSRQNRLIVHIYNAEAGTTKNSGLSKFLGRFLPRRHHSPYSQFHSNRATIECRTPAEAIIDGKKLGGTKFVIDLTPEEIRLITNRDSGEEEEPTEAT